jgi:hypothetical protein
VKKSQTEILDGNPIKIQFTSKKKIKEKEALQSKGPAWLMIYVCEGKLCGFIYYNMYNNNM